MGRKHIHTLREFTSAKSQERVGKDVVSVKNETMADIRRSEVKAGKPHNSKTYAQAARKEPKRGRVSFESETRKKHHGLTLKK
jgi:ribosomal protein L31E